MTELRIPVLRVQDFDPSKFMYDTVSKKIKLIESNDGTVFLTFVAGAVISGDKALMFQPDGTVVHADPTSSTYVYAGISLTAAQPGDNVAVQKEGPFTTTFWQWTFGLPVFVMVAGNVSQMAPPGPGYSHIIGRAVGSQTILLKVEDPIQL